jgi:hypothetical protein
MDRDQVIVWCWGRFSFLIESLWLCCFSFVFFSLFRPKSHVTRKELVFQRGSPAGLFFQFEPFVLMVVYVAR